MKAESCVLEFLERIGIKRGQKVLDFGCGAGTYAIPAARIVGDEGKVYALDKNRLVLNELMQKASSAGIENIERVDTEGELRMPLSANSVDVVILFDVLHSYYFPSADERKSLLDEIHRIAKADALILVYPKHIDSNVRDEIERANFHFQSEHTGTLVHDNRDLEQGQVFIFTKKTR